METIPSIQTVGQKPYINVTKEEVAMKKHVILITMSLLVVFILGFACVTYAVPVYVEGINDTETVDTGYSTDPFKEVVFLYTPSLSYDLIRVEFYTHSGSGEFTVRFREDIAGVPHDILGQSTFQLSGSSGFQGSDFISPISLVAGNQYWVGFYSEFGTGSHFASSGSLIPEYVDWDLDGNWDANPSTSTWLRPMMQFYGTVPEPTTMLLLGSGLIGLVAFRKRFQKA
jgi:hypothetical protein